MRIRILTIPDGTWSVVVDKIEPGSPLGTPEAFDRIKDVLKDCTGARGVMISVGEDIELPSDEASE